MKTTLRFATKITKLTLEHNTSEMTLLASAFEPGPSADDRRRVRQAIRIVKAWKTRLFGGKKAILRIHYSDGASAVASWEQVAALVGVTKNPFTAAVAIAA